jgi:hypothetical protein
MTEMTTKNLAILAAAAAVLGNTAVATVTV